MTITLYGIPNCDTVKKARAWLDAKWIAYTFHDYKKAGADPARIAGWIAAAGLGKVVNRAGTTFRKLSAEDQAALAEDKLLTPAKSMSQMRQIIFNDYVDTALAALFVAVVLSILFFGLRACVRALREAHPSSTETDNVRHQPAAA